MPTASGYADVSVGYTQTGLSRMAYITFGINPVDTNPALVNASVLTAITTAGSLNSIMDATATLSRIRVSLGTDGAEDLVSDASFTTVGGRTLAANPPNVAVLVHKRSARGGRRGRGRLFLPWAISGSNVSEAGIVTPAEVTVIQTAMGVFLGALNTQTVPMVLLHNPGLTTMGAPDPVTSLSVDRLISTQRRRLGR